MLVHTSSVDEAWRAERTAAAKREKVRDFPTRLHRRRLRAPPAPAPGRKERRHRPDPYLRRERQHHVPLVLAPRGAGSGANAPRPRRRGASLRAPAPASPQRIRGSAARLAGVKSSRSAASCESPLVPSSSSLTMRSATRVGSAAASPGTDQQPTTVRSNASSTRDTQDRVPDRWAEQGRRHARRDAHRLDYARAVDARGRCARSMRAVDAHRLA
jgi:hypothetical protein